jgi:hypothetical protein
MLQLTEDRSLRIKLITDPASIEFYSDILTRKHYLGSSAVNRNTLMHVVRRGRDDIAILTWEPKLRLRFGLRDELIGWTKEQRQQRLQYCVENRRFLMLIDEKNAASQCLAASMKELSSDGRGLFGHDFLLAETFIDPSRGYDGTCYKAGGWTEVGFTKGGRGKQERTAKLYFVKELKRDALEKLKAVALTPSDTVNPRQSKLCLEDLDFEGLRRKLEEVPDYRKIEGKNPLAAILALFVVAILCGATNLKAIHRWAKGISWEIFKNLGFRRPLSYTTAWRVMTNLDHQAFSTKLCEWLSAHADKVHIAGELKHLAFDGKTLRSASKCGNTQLHVINLINATVGVLMAQRMINDKEKNEIPCAQQILAQAPIDAATVVTGDAMHTQDATAERVLKKTVTMSLPSRIIKKTCTAPSKRTHPRRLGQYRSVLKSLDMGE